MGNQLRFSVLLLLLALWLPGPLRAQTLDPAFHIPELYGEAFIVDAAQMPSGQIVAAGTFTRANGQASKGLARFDAAGGEDQTFRQNLSGAAMMIQKLVPMPNGQLLVQGSYEAGTVRRNLLFRLNADGTLDAGFNLSLPNVGTLPRIDQAIVQPDGRVLITGLYLTNGNASERNLFRVLSDGSPDPSFSAALSTASQGGSILLQPDGKILVRGDFNLAVTGTRGLIRLNSDGSRDTGFRSALSPVGQQWIDCIALDANGGILVGGSVTTGASAAAQSLYRLLSTGALDPSFAAPASLAGRNLYQLEVLPNGQILVRAATNSAPGTRYQFNDQLVKLQVNGAVDAAFQPGAGPDSYVWGMRPLASGSFLTWGAMNNYAGQRRTLAMVQPSGGLDTGFAPLLQEPADIDKVVRQADGKLLISGRFNSVDGHLTDRVARLLPDGQPDLTFAWRQPRSGVWRLSALAVQANGQLLVAGNIYTSSANTSDSESLFVRLTTSGATDAGFVPALASGVLGPPNIGLLAAQANGQIIVGGGFVDATGKSNLTRLNADGSVEPTFAPPATLPGVSSGLVQANGAIVCVVRDASVAPRYQNKLVRLLATGAPDPAFNYVNTAGTGFDEYGPDVVAEAPNTGGYVAGGIFNASIASTRLVVGVTATGASLPGFANAVQPLVTATVLESGIAALAVQSDGRILVGGTIRLANPYNAPTYPLVRLAATGQVDASFSTSTLAVPATGLATTRYNRGASVSTIVVQPDGAILAGGYFLQAAGQPATSLARFLPTGVLAVRAAQEGSRIQAWPVPAHDVLHLQLEASARPQRVSLLDALGKTVISQPATAADVSLNTAALAPGLYVLRVDYASGPATRHVVVE
ncbi:T9SS type A sorting domain-containing protein [Hymenobacter convexus]|uniref:T9SS type A sorting domain-containing protein n=1 Tax=Hymenobacter sp. CA1UV-4 TaxID=3063782 RepID=UPI0027127C68|nr:T9SS type A sorting domain-containing protein [Hymenobacter sp. CA1UV-4]MDO7850797.1 T9SS type A sorting domain-containing protein [Hymenobacter sp. CA1UV-4]